MKCSKSSFQKSSIANIKKMLSGELVVVLPDDCIQR
jgi:hypothetical protein